jgi:hypothetical protein
MNEAMLKGMSYEQLRARAASLRTDMLEIDTKLSAKGRNDHGELAQNPRDYAQWRQRAVYAKQAKTRELMEVKRLMLLAERTDTGNGRRFWRGMCRSMMAVAEAVRTHPAAPPELVEQAEGALSDLALALASLPEDTDEVAG